MGSALAKPPTSCARSIHNNIVDAACVHARIVYDLHASLLLAAADVQA